jgi:hypothetical protein
LRHESNRSAPHTVVSTGQHRGATYSKVCDKRKRPIRGLWERGGRFYVQITVEEPVTGIKRVRRVPLEGATTESRSAALPLQLCERDHRQPGERVFRQTHQHERHFTGNFDGQPRQMPWAGNEAQVNLVAEDGLMNSRHGLIKNGNVVKGAPE